MDENVVQKMVRRIEVAERRVTRTRLALVLVVVLAGISALVSAGEAGAPQTIRASEIVLVDAGGQTRMVLRAMDEGSFIALYGPSRRDGPVISIGSIAADKGGGSQIFMWGSRGQRAVNALAQDRGHVLTW